MHVLICIIDKNAFKLLINYHFYAKESQQHLQREEKGGKVEDMEKVS